MFKIETDKKLNNDLDRQDLMLDPFNPAQVLFNLNYKKFLISTGFDEPSELLKTSGSLPVWAHSYEQGSDGLH